MLFFVKKRHIEPHCPKIKSTPKYQWNVKTAMQNIQGAGDDTGTEIGNTYEMSTIESSSRSSER